MPRLRAEDFRALASEAVDDLCDNAEVLEAKLLRTWCEHLIKRIHESLSEIRGDE